MSRQGTIRVLRSLVALAAVACLVLVSSLDATLAGDADWDRFKERFVTAQGRVIDTGNGNMSHSEGQAYGMLLAVGYDDRPSFESIWNWTRRNLALRDDGLFVWQWLPNVADPTPDLSPASDGDVLIAWALARAAARWGDDGYRDAARRLARVIRTVLVAEIDGRTLILPGPVWPRRATSTILNLSYWIFPAFQELSLIDPAPQWESLIRTGLELVAAARFGEWALPSDWMVMRNDGTLIQADEFPFVFGYEAVRVPLYYLWAGFEDKAPLRIYQAFWSATAKGHRLVNIIGLSTGEIVQREPVLAYRAVKALVDCAITGRPTGLFEQGFARYDDYYSAVTWLLAERVAIERLPHCLIQSDDKVSAAICAAA